MPPGQAVVEHPLDGCGRGIVVRRLAPKPLVVVSLVDSRGFLADGVLGIPAS
jgi:hypothetical protein